jgi:thiamine monophosphate synthase
VFAPRTDGHGKIPAGLDAVRGWARNPAAHVIALGGVSKDTAHDCIAAGARGLASIRGFFGAPEAVEQDVAAFVAALRHVSPRPTRR